MEEFRLPDLGEGMEEAEVVRWLVQPGETVKLDQPMVQVESDKAVMEIPAPVAGKVAEIYVPAGEVAKVGARLVSFEPSSPASSVATSSQSKTAQATQPVRGTSTAVREREAPHDISPQSGRLRVLAAPAVRKRAFELNIDLAQVPASASHGRVTMQDLETFLKQPRQQPETRSEAAPRPATNSSRNGTVHIVSGSEAAEERQPLTGLRKRIAERMELSWRTIPHATAFDEVDCSALVTLRSTLKPAAEQRGARFTYMPLLVKLLIPVLKEFPIFNASLDEKSREIVYKRVYHIGIATDSPEGLLVPVLRDADHLTLLEIAQCLEHLVEGAKQRKLSLPELSGSTFTLNNVGGFGGSSGTPIINYPEAAILAVGRIQEKLVLVDGQVQARPTMPLALSFDHRLIDGAQAGRFLGRLKALIEQPQQIMLDMA
ncbi:dihydrolipoamide acetyltransferase family protein [Ktedonobacter robiniae]|uniref:Dihydrolipoamide acetyltransferase component of pyruvate dehydrogenase complex n=1 Tax=Ktedonobacter robiniae TaxID=2778365 RepID=A0ABQ3UJ28_9CHLR|nr:dihydrolipoamide acetyltransferase family protein [Ktedonobacter robiniae]GHO52732.1 dihydrolipoyllysine-residue acetyltransferase component of pyruvate dehydrogenase complex [Ktedonobacter robiniae]